MTLIAPVQLAYNPKTLWFDPSGLELHKGDAVVVTTARGLEFGRLSEEMFEADEGQLSKLKSALKPVVRLASDEDAEHAEEMTRRSKEALPIFKEMAGEANHDMRPISVEFLFDGDKAVFYFEAEERVDFRELVRRLASHFRVRIDMRQIGVRDEARMIGGLGHCGQELCCKRLGGEFCPVSIRMAKEQDLSLNPQKISGVCGRLMCCLRYEFEAYKDFKSRAPKQNAQIETPKGSAKVVDLDVPREVVSLKLMGEKPVKVPLANFDPPEEGNRPRKVGQEAWEDATKQASLDIVGESTFLTSQFTNNDKLADPAKVRHAGSGEKGGSKARAGAGKNTKASPAAPTETRKPRRRRSTKVSADGTTQSVVAEETTNERKPRSSADTNGQRRSGARKAGANGNGNKKMQTNRAGTNADSSSNGNGTQNRKQNTSKNGQPAAKSTPAKQGPRPGQRSSGLRQQGGPSVEKTPSSGDGGQRRSRRRSHKSGGTQAGNQGTAPKED